MIVSVMGNIGAGKSTIIQGTVAILEADGHPCRHHQIEFLRKEVLEGKPSEEQDSFTWQDEDDAYGLLWERMHLDLREGRISFVETSGLARRMTAWNADLARRLGRRFLRVLVAARPMVCVRREKGREKRLEEFPLPFGHRPVQIVIREMAERIDNLDRDITLPAEAVNSATEVRVLVSVIKEMLNERT